MSIPPSRGNPDSGNISAMRKRRRILILAAVALLAVAAIVALMPAREPSYAGRSLSQWVDMLDSPPTTAQEQEAADAIRHIGTNAWPHLLKWIRYEKPHPPLPKLTNLLAGLFGHPPPVDPNRRRADAAEAALAILVPDCGALVLELVGLRRDRSHPMTAERAATAMFHVRPAALPTILAALTNTQTATRRNAAEAIGFIASRPGGLGTNSQVAATGLIQAVKDKDEELATAAAWALSNLKNVPDLVFSTLTNCLRDSRQKVQRQAACGLSDFGEKARPAVPVLIQCLKDTNAGVASLGAYSLGKLKLEPDSVVPALTECLQDPRQQVRREAARALRAYGEQARPALPGLLNLLTAPDFLSRVSATNALLQIAPEVLTNAPPPTTKPPL